MFSPGHWQLFCRDERSMTYAINKNGKLLEAVSLGKRSYTVYSAYITVIRQR